MLRVHRQVVSLATRHSLFFSTVRHGQLQHAACLSRQMTPQWTVRVDYTSFECFEPIVDPTTGEDLIPLMLQSQSVMDQEFGGMYCVVLTVNSVVVSAGVFRIFGGQIAELPLVATAVKNQGQFFMQKLLSLEHSHLLLAVMLHQGYFQALFSCIEELLKSLNVEHLVLPAAEEAASLWTNKFGFTKMPDEQFQNYKKDLQIMAFKGASMLKKALPRHSSGHVPSNKAV
eukprot:Gb_21354 [translate_table: standard]